MLLLAFLSPNRFESNRHRHDEQFGSSLAHSQKVGIIVGSVFGSVIGCAFIFFIVCICCDICKKRHNNVFAYNGRLQTIRSVNIAPPPYNRVVTTAPQQQNTVLSAPQYQNTGVPLAPPPYSAPVFTMQPGGLTSVRLLVRRHSHIRQ